MSKTQAQPVASSLKAMIFALMTVAVSSAIILGIVYQITQKPIEDAKNNLKLEAIKEVIPGEFDNNPFEDRIIRGNSKNRDQIEIYPGRQGKDVKGVAVKSYTNKAFGGHLELIVGFFLDGTINSFKVIEHKETPGLGSRVNEPKFRDQFKGINPSDGGFKLRQEGGKIDAVTAATISSRAVLDAISRAHKTYIKLNAGK